MKIERCFLLLSVLLIGCAREVTPVTDGGQDVPALPDVLANDVPRVVLNAVILNSCGPADGPEVDLVIATGEMPPACVLSGDNANAVVITILWTGPLAVGVYMGTGTVPSVCDAGACPTAGGASVTFTSYDNTRSIAVGTYSLTLANGTTVTGTFSATICHNIATCG